MWRKPPPSTAKDATASGTVAPSLIKRLSVRGSIPSDVSATSTCAADSQFSVPQLAKPPLGSWASDSSASASSTAACTAASPV